MKLWFFVGLNFLSFTAWSRPSVLISYFDAFGGAKFNNSERIATTLQARLNSPDGSFEIKLCALNTVFDKAYAQTEECLKNLPEKPLMVIGLGESTCELKPETILRNIDKSVGPDNDGNERKNEMIVSNGPSAIGLRYPLPQMYCSLTSAQRKSVDISNNAGSFVCNNTAYQMSYFHPELQYGFIHVPSNNCFNLDRKTEVALVQLETMLIKGVTYLLSDESDERLPHRNNEVRLPTERPELKKLRKTYENEDCLGEYFERSKSAEERSGIFFDRMN